MTRSPADLNPASTVDRFTVDSVLAHGMTSTSYRVTDTETGSPYILLEYVPVIAGVHREQAVFVADHEQAASELSAAVAGFLADGTQASTLNHAGLLPVSRWFRANGTAYLVSPHIAGETLSKLLQRSGKLNAEELLEVAHPLLDALEYLHSQEMIHQQVMPEHVLVTESGNAVLLTCGGSALPDYKEAETSSYAAIEQSDAEGKVGPWTDIYSLAATLYHGLTGTPAATARLRSDAGEGKQADPLLAIESAADATAAQREAATLITRGLSLDSSARAQSIREWRARITRFASADGQPDEMSSRPVAAKKEREWLPVVLLSVFLIAIAGVAIYLISNRSSNVADTGNATALDASQRDAASEQEVERWRQALDANAVVAYRNFMNDYPDSIHYEQAQEHIKLLEDKAWAKVLEENTRAAFESHLEQFPQGQYATLAQVRIEEFKQEVARLARENDEKIRLEDQAWNTAKAGGSVAALDNYISSWPGGEHVSEARELRKEMQTDLNDHSRFEQVAEKHTIEDYRAYISDFPGGRHVSAALEAIDSLTLRIGKSFRDCPECPEMVVLPAGSFWQGSAENSEYAISIEKPRRRVTISDSFAAGKYEVTLSQWDRCVSQGGCETAPADNGWGRADRPVIMVSWNDAMQYADWLSTKTGQSYSLPSESQWEYFARAGEEGEWLGGGAQSVCDYANIAADETRFEWRHQGCEDGAATTTSTAGSYRPNAFGLYDVIGNVAEWTLDCMNLSYLEAPADGSAWSRGMCSSRMTRGGSWFTGTRESRLGSRFNLKNGDRNDFTGFRLVRLVEKQ